MKIFDVFTDKGEWSWRKFMTAGCLLSFLVAVFGYLIQHNFEELPASYLAIIGGVFGFYFMKSFFRNIKVTEKE